jgi:hypothetical protein
MTGEFESLQKFPPLRSTVWHFRLTPTVRFCIFVKLDMAVRSSLTLTFKGKKHAGEYEIDGGVLSVFFEGRSKTSVITGTNPELLARLLLIELVYRVPSWRE